MAGRGRPKLPLVLLDEEREVLVRWSRRAKSSQALALRCRIVLGCAEDGGLRANQDVAAQLGIWPQTVTKWRKRFLDRRLEGLADEPRPGAPRRITDERVEEVIVKTLEATPANATHWSRSSMAAQSGLSKSTIGRVWKAFGLKPHLAETFKLSNDPQFIDKVRDVVGLYLDPPEKALVLAVDEKWAPLTYPWVHDHVIELRNCVVVFASSGGFQARFPCGASLRDRSSGLKGASRR